MLLCCSASWLLSIRSDFEFPFSKKYKYLHRNNKQLAQLTRIWPKNHSNRAIWGTCSQISEACFETISQNSNKIIFGNTLLRFFEGLSQTDEELFFLSSFFFFLRGEWWKLALVRFQTATFNVKELTLVGGSVLVQYLNKEGHWTRASSCHIWHLLCSTCDSQGTFQAEQNPGITTQQKEIWKWKAIEYYPLIKQFLVFFTYAPTNIKKEKNKKQDSNES